MNRENVKTLQDLVRQSAANYGDKVFLKEKAENNTIQIVKNLLKQNLDINLISKVTGMSVNKIKSLNIN